MTIWQIRLWLECLRRNRFDINAGCILYVRIYRRLTFRRDVAIGIVLLEPSEVPLIHLDSNIPEMDFLTRKKGCV